MTHIDLNRRRLLLGIPALAMATATRVAGDEQVRSSPMAGFDEYMFTQDNKPRRVFVQGNGPPVLVLHELPGLSEDDIHLARALVEKGLRVHVPLLFSHPGANLRLFGYFPACEFGGPFSCIDGDLRNPISGWLLELTRHIAMTEGKAMGIIGMCLTGTVPLTLLRADAVQAIVLAQPTLPFKYFPWNRSALGIPKSDLTLALQLAEERKLSVYMVRFKQDRISSHRSFVRLASLLQALPNVTVICHELEGNEHSVFGHELAHGTSGTTDAFTEMVQLLHRALGA